MNQQLALAIQLNDEATMEDFYWCSNQLLHQCMQDLLANKNSEHFLYLFGVAGSGKSHLLQACCQALHEGEAIYLPLYSIKNLSPDILEGIDNHTLLCIDDIDAIARDAAWEEALFHLYNRVRESQSCNLVVTSKTPPIATPIQLPDLKSRLSWGLVFQLHELEDKDKITALQRRAETRGFELPASVIQFLMARCARNMHDLHHLLNQLDETSLAAQRKITIPFVKEALNL